MGLEWEWIWVIKVATLFLILASEITIIVLALNDILRTILLSL